MDIALDEAKKALSEGEVPVGAVVVKDGIVIGRGHNKRESKNDVTSHAEIEAIREAEKLLGTWKLNNCSLYVTLEPCLMCAGAIIQSQIFALYYGCDDKVKGAITSSYFVFDECNETSRPLIYKGIKENECSLLIKEFFKNQRKKNN